MEIDLENRIKFTPLSSKKYLYPLFEAIANSMHSIAEAKENDGRIIIHIKRDTADMGLGSVSPDAKPSQPIIGFVVEDNGIGFTDDNLESFKKVHSPKKRKVGGKGVGRLLWLKAFRKAEIDSTYQSNGSLERRTFEFSIAHNGVGVESQQESNAARCTTVHLKGFLPPYADSCTQNTDIIARKIINHFISHFIIGAKPTITIKDDYEDTELDLNREFKTKMRLECEQTTTSLKGYSFKLEHLCLKASASSNSHEMLFSTQGRVVEQADLQEYIPTLRNALRDDDDKLFFYSVLVTSTLFDGDGTDWERTRLNLIDQKDVLEGEKVITRQEIFRKIADSADKYLKKYLEPLREKNTERIVSYIVKTEPKYRPLIKHRRHWFERIAPGLSDEALSVELYRLQMQYQLETKQEIASVKRKIDNPVSAKLHKEKFNHLLTEINDQAIASLADYVVHRRAVLDFLRESIKQLPTGGYVAEKFIHEIICPLKTTTDDVSLDQMNLWILDERLNFHHYLSSDRPQKSVKPLQGGSDDRADIILFNHALAFADQDFSSIVIVEFKRPMRDDYTDEENPIDQVIRYVEEITSGKVLSKSGRPIPQNTPIYAYIVCDITEKLRTYSRRFSFTPHADARGFFTYLKDYNLYMEMIGFDKLADDAERRNSAFFDKMNLPLTAQGH